MTTPPQEPLSEERAKHEHVWEPVGITTTEKIGYSPVSALDHVVYTIRLAVMSCKCGAIRRKEVGRSTRWLNR